MCYPLKHGEWRKRVKNPKRKIRDINLPNIHDSDNQNYEILNPDRTINCRVCLTSDNRSEIVLCDRCDNEYHIKCLNPPLKTIPNDEWFCPTCERILDNNEDLFINENTIGHEIKIRVLIENTQNNYLVYDWKNVYLFIFSIIFYIIVKYIKDY